MYITSFNMHKPYNKIIYSHCTGFPGGSVVKILLSNEGVRVQSLSQEDPLEEEMETHYSILV